MGKEGKGKRERKDRERKHTMTSALFHLSVPLKIEIEFEVLRLLCRPETLPWSPMIPLDYRLNPPAFVWSGLAHV